MTAEQIFPYPTELSELVKATTYRAFWDVALHNGYERDEGSYGLTLIITTFADNSYNQERKIRVNHLFPVPPATYNRQNWTRWLFEQFAKVELHEAMEFFTVDGVKPYAPNHGPGNDPYTVHETSTPEERNTRFTGEQSHPVPPIQIHGYGDRTT